MKFFYSFLFIKFINETVLEDIGVRFGVFLLIVEKEVRNILEFIVF